MNLKLKDYQDTGYTILDTYKGGPIGKGSFVSDERTLELIQSEKNITKLNINRGKDLDYIEYEKINELFFTYDFLTCSDTYKKYMIKLGNKFQKDKSSLEHYNPIFINDKLIQFRTDNNKYGKKYYGLIIYKNSKIFHNINSYKFRNKSEETIRYLSVEDSEKDNEFISKVFEDDFGDNFYYETINGQKFGNGIMNKILNEKTFYHKTFFDELKLASSIYSYKFYDFNGIKMKKFVKMIPCGILFIDKNILG